MLFTSRSLVALVLARKSGFQSALPHLLSVLSSIVCDKSQHWSMAPIIAYFVVVIHTNTPLAIIPPSEVETQGSPGCFLEQVGSMFPIKLITMAIINNLF